MCRSIKPLFNLDPPTTDEEIGAASLQFIRKVSGQRQPSQLNEAAFEQAVTEVAETVHKLLDSLKTQAAPHQRTKG